MSKYKFVNKGRSHTHTLARDEVNYSPLKGTTTIINEVFPPPLAWYGSAKALELFGFITEKKEPDEMKRKALLEKGLADLTLLIEGEDRLDKYADFLSTCYSNHDAYKRQKGKEGTDMHAMIEEYIKKCITEANGMPLGAPAASGNDKSPIFDFVVWACKDVKQFLWSEAHCFSEKLWVGGICDFGFVHKNGKIIIGDAKSGTYSKYFIQTALYGIQIKENGLFTEDGTSIPLIEQAYKTQIDGYMIWNYNESIENYRTDVEYLENLGRFTVEVYDKKDIIGTNTL